MRTVTAARAAVAARPVTAVGQGPRHRRPLRAARRLATLTLLAALAGLGAVAAPPAAAVASAAGDGPSKRLVIDDERITESSGLTASVRHPGVLYTHNDSGDDPRVYAVGPDGDVVAALTLAGVDARDWEGIAAGRDEDGEPALFVGDIGDNLGGAWPSVAVYRIPEPAELRDATIEATRYRLRYADGPRDAEALLVHPGTNRLYVASKQRNGGGLYAAPKTLRTDRVNVLKRVAKVPPAVTDGAYSPDGGSFVLRDYVAAYVYLAPGKRLGTLPLPLQLQAESITYDREEGGLLTGSEGAGSRVWHVPLSEELAPRPEGEAAGGGTGGGREGTPAAAGAEPDGAAGIWPPRGLDLVLLLAGAALIAFVALVGLAWRRR